MFQGLIRQLQQFGVTIIKIIQDVFKQLGKDASGETAQSLNQAIEFDSSGAAIDLDITGSKVFDFIEKGRKPNSKLPPEKPIVEWLKIRGIPVAASYAVRKAIAVNGIEPVPVLELSFVEIQKAAVDVSQEMLFTLATNLGKRIKDGFEMP